MKIKQRVLQVRQLCAEYLEYESTVRSSGLWK